MTMRASTRAHASEDQAAPEDRVLATLALLSGALDARPALPELSDRILRAARRMAVPETRRGRSRAPWKRTRK